MTLTPAASASELQLLLVPGGQLSADGQLRELMAERRRHRCRQAPLWFLDAPFCRRLGLGPAGVEAVACADLRVLVWLQLRFGGKLLPSDLRPDRLQREAADLPPPALPAASLSPASV